MATDKKHRVKWLVTIKGNVDKSGMINKFYPCGVRSYIIYRFTDGQEHKVHAKLWMQFSTSRLSPLQELHEIQHIADTESGEAQAKQLAQVILAQEGRADYRTNLVLKSVAASPSRLSVNAVIENNVFPTNAQCLFFNTPGPSLVSPGKGSSHYDVSINNLSPQAVQNYFMALR